MKPETPIPCLKHNTASQVKKDMPSKEIELPLNNHNQGQNTNTQYVNFSINNNSPAPLIINTGFHHPGQSGNNPFPISNNFSYFILKHSEVKFLLIIFLG